MYLKSLKIRGFKSFADKTELDFEPGLIAVVGPNGSGKSNITDAVLWVLGEQSATTLRGSSMEDVIFAGGPSRSALGAAEVIITFDNVDKVLPIEYTEVSITRRVSRSGESGYYINGAPCRLLDIQDLLSDTGIGREMHTIISQGKIDQVLSSRPEEIRMMIEESAGLLKYRKRKEKVLRKLERLDQDILRLGDIERELRKQLRPLQEQADRAKQHTELASELKCLEVGLAVEQIRGFQEQWQTNDGKSEAGSYLRCRIEEWLESRHGDIKSLEKEAQAAGGASQDRQESRREAERILDRTRSSAMVLEERQRIYMEKINKLESERLIRLNEEEAAQSRAKEFEVRNDEVTRELLIVEQELEMAAGVRNEIDSRIRELDEKTEAGRTSIDDHRRRIQTLKQEHTQVQAEQSELQGQLAILRSRDKTILGRIEEYEAQISEHRQNRESALRASNDLTDALSSCAAIADGCMNIEKARLLTVSWRDLASSEIEGLASSRDRWETQRIKVTAKIAEASARLTERQEIKAELAEGIRQLELEIEAEEQQIQKAVTDRNQLVSEREIKVNVIQELKIKKASLAERSNALKSQLAGAAVPSGGTSLTSIMAEMKVAEQKIQLLNRLATHNNAVAERILMLLENIERCCASSADAVTDYSQRLEDLNQECTDGTIVLDEIRDWLHALELEQTQLQIQVSSQAQRIVEDFEVPLDHAVERYRLDKSCTVAREEIKRLKRRLGTLGPVNPIAINEFAALQDRYDVLAEQVADVKKSRKDLRRIVDEIDERIKSTFCSTFEQVNRHFNKIITYLFDGGQGQLQMIDPDDMLDTGVDIEVRPGKKKTQKLTLLSGGERSLAAIALLFALYETRPSPFYILDEVEAALDDINLQRFSALLERYRSRTQFLIITHQKRTMEMADVLYGITMKQDGTSKLISQKLAGKGLEHEVDLVFES